MYVQHGPHACQSDAGFIGANARHARIRAGALRIGQAPLSQPKLRRVVGRPQRALQRSHPAPHSPGLQASRGPQSQLSRRAAPHHRHTGPAQWVTRLPTTPLALRARWRLLNQRILAYIRSSLLLGYTALVENVIFGAARVIKLDAFFTHITPELENGFARLTGRCWLAHPSRTLMMKKLYRAIDLQWCMVSEMTLQACMQFTAECLKSHPACNGNLESHPASAQQSG